MEKDQKVLISLIVIIFLVVAGVLTYLFMRKSDINTDALKFKKEYESLNNKKDEKTKEKYLNIKVDSSNIFIYKSDEDILNVIDKENALIYFGFAECSYCRSMVSILNEVAKEKNLKKIYYVDILNIRDSYEIIEDTVVKITNGTSSYYKLLDVLDNYLSDYLIKEDNKEYHTGVKRLYAPTVVAIKDKKIVGFHEGTIDSAKEKYILNEEETKQLKSIYEDIIDKMTSNVCINESC